MVTVICTGCTGKERIKQKISEKSAQLHMSKEAEPIPVTVQVLEKEDVFSSTNYVGRVEPSKSAIIMNQYPGTLEELYAVKGRNVSKGEVLGKVHSEAVLSAYEMARVTLAQAEDGYARAQQVYKEGGVTEVKMVEIRTQLAKARAAESSAKQALDECTVRAPFDGVVGDIYCHNGEHVGAASPLVQILDIGDIEIHFSVPENEYNKIAVGARAQVEIPAAEKTVGASVAVKGISASALSHAYDFTLKGISDPRSLMPGMVCKVRLTSSGDGELVIPATAVMTDTKGRYVWNVTEDETVCKTYVAVGGYAGKGIIISEGLNEGDKVIVEGSRKVSTGMKVKSIAR